MPNILLIDSNTTPFNEAFPVYPIGLDYLQGALKQAGFSNTHLLDLRQAGGDVRRFEQRPAKSLEVITRKLSETRWDIIGIGIRNIDSTYPPDPTQLNWHYYLLQIKAYVDHIRATAGNKSHIILGGSGFSMMPDEILGYLGGDGYGVVGPAEVALPQLIADVLDNKAVKRIYWTPEVMIGRLQNLALLEEYRYLPQGMGTVGLRTKNGCGAHCGYCPYPAISGNQITLKPTADVLDEVRTLREIGFSSFMFTDDIFNASPKHAKEILRGMLDAGEIPRSWHTYLSPKAIDEELLELIVETNGWSYYPEQHRIIIFPFDLDSGCDRMLQTIGKGYTSSDIRHALATFDNVKKRYENRIHSISSVFHLLLGYPGEDESSIRESCQLVNETLPERLSFQIGVRVYPHTPLADETRGMLWHKPEDLLEPTFAPFSKTDIRAWLTRYLDPQYHVVSEAGNMIQLIRQ